MKACYLFAPSLAAVVTALPAAAAEITWNAAYELVNDADLDTTGDVLYAINGGQEEVVVGIGGKNVTFESGATTSNVVWGVAGEEPASAGLGPQLTPDYDLYTLAGAAGGASTGNPALDTVLDSQAWMAGVDFGQSALTILLQNLTPGQQYRVQLIGAADARLNKDAQDRLNYVDDLAGNIGLNLGRFVDLDNDGEFHVATIVGTFTADATTQNIHVVLQDNGLSTNKSPGISALVVSTVPEPATSALLGLGALLGMRRR